MQNRQPVQAPGEFIDFRTYLDVLRRRALTIAIVAGLGFGLAVGYSRMQTPIYTATASVLVKPPPESAGQNLNNLISIGTEAQVVKSLPVADAAGKTLGSSIALQLLHHVSVKTTAGSFVMEISYWDPNPDLAALGANAFATAYVDYKTQQGEAQVRALQDAVSAQLLDLKHEQDVQNRIIDTNPPGSAAYRNARDSLDQLGVRQAVLGSVLAAVPQVVDPAQVILPASTPKSASSPRVLLNAALGLFLGLLAGVVLAFVRERLDDRVHREGDIELYTDAPVLATVPHVRGRKRDRSSLLIVDRESRSPITEAYRTIRASVLSMADKRGLTMVGIMSGVHSEGKTMTSANVAAALGQTGKRVLVVSADMRKPTIHEFFGVTNELGLAEVLEGTTSFGEAVVKSDVDNIWVLAGGQSPEHPAELLQSPEMVDLLGPLREQFDFVIVDCPPVLGLADCLAVLPLVDAVIMVVQAGRTRGEAILEVGDRLERMGVSVDAVVMNDVRISRGRPGHHSYGYYLPADEGARPTRRQSQGSPRSVPPKAVEAVQAVQAVPQGNAAVKEAERSQRDDAERANPGLFASNGEASAEEHLEPSSVLMEET